MADGRLAEACAAFEESQKLQPAVTTLLNLAGCREQNGQLATAWGLFIDAERQTRNNPDATTLQLHDVAQNRATQLESRVSKLTIHVAVVNQIEGLTITRGEDTVDPQTWNRTLPVDGGLYTITARAPEMAPWSTQVTVAREFDNKTVDVPRLVPKPAEANAVSPTTGTTLPAATTAETTELDETATITNAQRGTNPWHKWSYVVGGAGGAALIAAFAIGLDAKSKYNQSQQHMHCNSSEVCDSTGFSLATEAIRDGNIATGLGVAGIVAIGGSAVMWVLTRTSEAPSRTAIVPSFDTHGGSIAILGRL